MREELFLGWVGLGWVGLGWVGLAVTSLRKNVANVTVAAEKSVTPVLLHATFSTGKK